MPSGRLALFNRERKQRRDSRGKAGAMKPPQRLKSGPTALGDRHEGNRQPAEWRRPPSWATHTHTGPSTREHTGPREAVPVGSFSAQFCVKTQACPYLVLTGGGRPRRSLLALPGWPSQLPGLESLMSLTPSPPWSKSLEVTKEGKGPALAGCYAQHQRPG